MFFGFGELENVENALELYKRSAELGNPKAMMALGRIFEQGIGTKADPIKAY
jgi:TPR repeat protein